TRTELQAALVVFAREAFQDETWLARMPMEQLMNTTTLREITAEAERKGRVEGALSQARATLAALLAERFGIGPQLPEHVEQRLAQATRAELLRWLSRPVPAPSRENVFG